jgi:ubiquinone/menaquinone biosynthesis C-methylase UbiE
MSSDVELQRAYYGRTAADYDESHVFSDVEHEIAFDILAGWLPRIGVETILDVGAGTGRAQRRAAEIGLPQHITGIEPVAALRDVGHRNGVPKDRLIEGDATRLPFADDSVDLAMEFAVLHHIRDHRRAVAEMCRVARKGVFISDSNNFGQGSFAARVLKNGLWATGLWPLADFLRTRGKGYHWSEGDGIFYSYSVLDSIPVLRAKFPQVYIFTTQPSGSSNLRFSAQHLAVLALPS